MIIGYTRVSTLSQNDQLQRDALERAGAERIFADVAVKCVDIGRNTGGEGGFLDRF